MRSIYVLITLSASLLYACCSSPDRFSRISELVESSPDSALLCLKKQSYSGLSEKERALYGLLYMRIMEKQHRPLEPDTLLTNAEHFYTKHNCPNELATCYWLRGHKQAEKYQFEAAMNNYLMALDLVPDNNNLKANILFDTGVLFNQQGEYGKARTRFMKAFTYCNAAGNKRSSFYCMLYIGRTYYEEKNHCQALAFYKQYDYLCHDSVARGALLQETGINFYGMKQFDSAFIYLHNSLKYPYKYSNGSLRYSFLADLYFDAHKIDSAICSANKALSIQSDMRIRKCCFRILSNCYFTKNNSEKARFYMAKYQDCSDSIRAIEAQARGSFVEKIYKAEKQVVVTYGWIGYLSVAIILVVVCSVLIYLYKHYKQLVSKRELEATINQQKQEKEAMLTEQYIAKRNSIREDIDKKRHEQKLFNNASSEYTLRIKKMYADILHYDNSNLFFDGMNRNFNNIVTRLTTCYPDLNRKELEWCCLQILEIPTHEMLILLDYKNDNSLKRLKTRLSPKFKLENAAGLATFLARMITPI